MSETLKMRNFAGAHLSLHEMFLMLVRGRVETVQAGVGKG